MATEQTIYLTYLEAVVTHIELMQQLGEARFGVAEPTLVESALARPHHAAVYEHADIIRQAATLCLGLIKNHPWVGGNKRTATALMDTFLWYNGWQVTAMRSQTIEMVLRVESDRWQIDEIEAWLRQHTIKIEENR